MRISQEGCEMLDLGPTEVVQSPSLETVRSWQDEAGAT